MDLQEGLGRDDVDVEGVAGKPLSVNGSASSDRIVKVAVMS